MACLVVAVMAVSGIACAEDGSAPPMKGMHHHHMMMHDGKMGCPLPPEKAKLVHERMKADFEKDKPLFDQMRKLHEKMRDIAKADKFDRKAFLAAADEIADVQAKLARHHAEAMADIAEQLTPKEREAMANFAMMHHGPGGPGMFHRGGWKHGDWKGGKKPGCPMHGKRINHAVIDSPNGNDAGNSYSRLNQ